MKIMSPFANKEDFNTYIDLSYFSRNGREAYDIAANARENQMSESDLELYTKYYEEFNKEYNLSVSGGGAGRVLRSDGIKRDKLETLYKLYIDPGVDTVSVARLFIEECKKNGMEYTLKVMTPEEVKSGRGERLAIYGTSAEHIKKTYDVLKEIIGRNKELKFGKPPILSGNIDGIIGFGYDGVVSGTSYNRGMANIMAKAATKFFIEIQKRRSFPNSYISGNVTKKLNKEKVLKDFPEIKRELQEYLNQLYIDTMKNVPGIEEFLVTDIPQKKQQNQQQYQLPKGAQWKINSRGEYILQITDEKTGAKQSYSAETARKKFGVKPSNKQQETRQTNSQLPKGAQWKLNARGEYILQIIDEKTGAKQSYSAKAAFNKFGIKPQTEQKRRGDTLLDSAINATEKSTRTGTINKEAKTIKDIEISKSQEFETQKTVIE